MFSENKNPLALLQFFFFGKYYVVVDLLLLASLWILSVIFTNPFGDFPLNDDWSYGKAVKHLLEEGIFRPTGWTSMPLITHTLWGALFCIPFGFSFTALRFSTLSLALIGILGTYFLLKHVRAPRYMALIAALIVAVNPIYFALSNTFMTDVPFTAFTVLALLFLVLALKFESDMYLVVGTFFATTAILCRQLGLAIPIAFTIAFLIKKGISLSAILRAGLPIIAGFGVLIGFENWMELSGELPILYDAQKMNLLNVILSGPKYLLWTVSKNIFVAVVYLGLFLLPFIVLLPQPFSLLKKRQALINGIIFAIFTILGTLLIVLRA